MTQDRLANLAKISIENDIAEKLDLGELIQSFASQKSRKKSFH